MREDVKEIPHSDRSVAKERLTIFRTYPMSIEPSFRLDPFKEFRCAEFCLGLLAFWVMELGAVSSNGPHFRIEGVADVDDERRFEVIPLHEFEKDVRAERPLRDTRVLRVNLRESGIEPRLFAQLVRVHVIGMAFGRMRNQ